MFTYLICNLISFLAARYGFYPVSGAVLLAAAVRLYYADVRRTGRLFHLRALFSLSWVGGEGMACLKLSRLQSDWALLTWVTMTAAFLAFWASYEWMLRSFGREEEEMDYGIRRHSAGTYVRALYFAILGLSALSTAAFGLEAWKLGFIPFFLRGVPHAYSVFHLTGVHYITVSCCLIPSLAVIYGLQGGSRYGYRNLIVIALTGWAFLIPILCVSRFQLIFAAAAAFFTYAACRREVPVWIPPAILLFLLPLYVILTVARSHDAAYLAGIFEMKSPAVPIFLAQPYIYIANNYDNLNCLVENLPAFSHGLRMLNPLWCLSGLKFFFPALVDWPIYVDKAELTTLTLFYDAYYDFGVLGVTVFGALLGAVSYLLTHGLADFRNPAAYLLYAQFTVYLLLSFFTTWFSNPTTWFYFAVTAAIAFLCGLVGES